MIRAIFSGTTPEWSGLFIDPDHVYFAHDLATVAHVVNNAEAAALAGSWVILALAYEAAPAMDPALSAHPPTTLPLAFAATFSRPAPTPPPSSPPLPSLSWKPLVTWPAYKHAVERILNYIATGHTYQVNYTFPMVTRAPSDLEQWYHALCAAQAAPFSCFISTPDFSLLCLSPELFFTRRGSSIIARPMKGTLPRGRWWEEDCERQRALATCPKNRAENLMIVDMLRNDLGRIAQCGSVHVPTLFSIESYHTVLQMTSTVTARLRPAVSLWDIFSALFPCASITGAPKVRTMQIIRELEPYPRGFYTGAIALLQPGGNCTCNVAIRTIVSTHHDRCACFSVGGGIVADSNPAHEYEECRVKAAFLHTPRPAFQLLESLLLDHGEYWLLPEHLSRLRSSATFFSFSFDESAVREALRAIALAHKVGRFKVRLLLSPTGKTTLEAEPLPAHERPWALGVAPSPVSSHDVFLFHKTTHRVVYEAAARACPGADDVVLWNQQGEITETTRANIVVQLHGQLITPPRTAGLLAGTFRAALLAQRRIVEKSIFLDQLLSAPKIWLINSVRGWIDVDMPHLRAALALHQQTRQSCSAVGRQ
ncbi:MAG: aminodeoxychorismate synthase component I [bacterium]|nr:aminodeoxychorismate synthase component I [bacterium]